MHIAMEIPKSSDKSYVGGYVGDVDPINQQGTGLSPVSDHIRYLIPQIPYFDKNINNAYLGSDKFQEMMRDAAKAKAEQDAIDALSSETWLDMMKKGYSKSQPTPKLPTLSEKENSPIRDLLVSLFSFKEMEEYLPTVGWIKDHNNTLSRWTKKEGEGPERYPYSTVDAFEKEMTVKLKNVLLNKSVLKLKLS